MKRALLLGLLLALAAGEIERAAAEDRGLPTWYVVPRVGTAVLLDTSLPGGLGLSRRQQDSGVTLGVNLSRRIGAEIAADAFEANLKGGGRTIGEYGMFTLLPQVRIRFPIESLRLTPYAVAGLGASFAEFNDRKKTGIGRRVRADNTALAAAVGGGLEYAVSREVAVGLDVRYVTFGDQDIRVDERGGRARLHALLIGGTMRLLVDPNVPVDPPAPATDGGTRFAYLVARAGGAAATRSRIASGVEAEPENAAIGGQFNLLFGVGVGVDVTRHLGVELVADGHECILDVPGRGSAGEYAIYTVVPQLRARYPMLDERLVPYAVAGLGVSYAEFNDRKPPGLQSELRGTNFGAVAAVGAGIEWFLSSSIALGLETRYHHFTGHELKLGGEPRDARPHAVLTTLGLRIYLGWPPL
jgi:opacity protein-like surface antigen